MTENANPLSCIILDKEGAKLKQISDALKDYSFITVVGSFTETMDAVAFLTRKELTFLIIDSQQILENDTSRIIRKLFPDNRVIVTGNGEGDFIKTFTIGRYHFLNKPFDKPELLSVMKNIYQDEVLDRMKSSEDIEVTQLERNGLFVKGDSGYVRIDFDEIDYIKAFGEYSKLYRGKSWVLLSCTLKKITEQLPKRTFARVHRSFTVRIGSIESFDAHEIKMGSDFVPIGRNYKKDFESSVLRLT